MNRSFESDPDRIDQEAAEWIARLDRDLSEEEEVEFLEWLEKDPLNAKQLKALQSSWSFCDKLGQQSSAIDVLGNGNGEAGNRGPLAIYGTVRYWTYGIAAIVLFSFASFWFIQRKGFDKEPTPVFLADGEHALQYERHILEDSSVVELNAGAQVEVLYSRECRRLKLHEGAAHFIVTKNPERPFIVEVNGLEIRAVGTAFSLKLQNTSLEVLVTEGRVRVGREVNELGENGIQQGEISDSSMEYSEDLVAGQMTFFSTGNLEEYSGVIEPTIQEISRQLSWREEVLEFSSTPLNEVVAAFNQRNFVKIVIIDKRLNQLKINATVNPCNLESFIEMLEASTGARSEWTDSAKVLLRK